MPRYILIDTNSGYIFGDSADFAGGRNVEGPVEACRLLDESLGVSGRRYTEHRRKTRFLAGSGYDVYRADIEGSEAVPVVRDGQAQETIEAVTRSCEHVAWVQVDDDRTE